MNLPLASLYRRRKLDLPPYCEHILFFPLDVISMLNQISSRSCYYVLYIVISAAIHNTEAFSRAGGLSTLIRNILDTQLLRINESVTLTVLHLLNHPSTRRFIRFKADIEVGIAAVRDEIVGIRDRNGVLLWSLSESCVIISSHSTCLSGILYR